MSPYPAYLNDVPLTPAGAEPTPVPQATDAGVAEPAAAPAPRKVTADEKNPDGSTTVTVQRCCNGCGRPIGDVTEAEVDCAIAGLPLPDVRAECGCLVAPASLKRHDRYQQLSTYRKPRLAGMVGQRYAGDLGRWSKHDLITTILESEGYPLAWDSHPVVKP